MSAMTAPIGRRRTSAAICSDVGRQTSGEPAASVARAGGDRRWEGARGGAGSASSAPGDTLAPSITPIPHVIADFAHPRHRSSALIGRHNCRSGGPGQPGEHHAGNPQHTQLLKSP